MHISNLDEVNIGIGAPANFKFKLSPVQSQSERVKLAQARKADEIDCRMLIYLFIPAVLILMYILVFNLVAIWSQLPDSQARL
jgi:hypothetical protein